MGRLLEAILALACVAAIGALLLHSGEDDRKFVLDKPGTIGEVQGKVTRAKAFYQQVGGSLRLTVFFSDAGDSEQLFSTSVRLQNNQQYSIEVGGDDDGVGGEKYLFIRFGPKIEMRVLSRAKEQISARIAE